MSYIPVPKIDIYIHIHIICIHIVTRSLKVFDAIVSL